MKKEPLVKLLSEIEQEMLRLGYSKCSMRFYSKRWQMLLEFAKKRNEKFFSEQLGIDFLKKHFHILKKNFNGPLSQADAQELRIIRVIGDFQLHHAILRRYGKQKVILTEPRLIAILKRFESYCIKRDYSKCTVDHYVKQSTHFISYLVSQNILEYKKITLRLIHSYIRTLVGYSYKTVEQNICSIRSFLRFLFEKEILKTDLASKVAMVKARKQTRIPSVWTEDELRKLISAIDRGSPQGKRDYAIILLACCLGMRGTDIKNLKINNFNWEEKKLTFVQSKTRNPISLPLTLEVGWAVIDYLRYGRPQIESPYIFLRHLAPFGPFTEGDHLHQLIKKYMVIAHISTHQKKRGLHSLRHTMASMLLEKNTPLSTISDILGHMDTDSTAIYLKVDIKKLRECALSFKEENDHE